MAGQAGSTSTIKRLRTSASNRLTEALLASSGKVAGVGLATATLTLAFAIWFGFGLRHQSEVGAPLAHSAAVLNASLSQSLAALRAWVAYGDAASRAERSRIWDEQIEPTLGRIKVLAVDSDVANTVVDVAA